MSIIHVLLTGGVGSRLWPLSRKQSPKQYLDLFDGKSLFEMTVQRNQCVADKVVIVGNRDNTHLSHKAMVNCGLPYKNIVEATPRNTAAAIAFAALAVEPKDILIVTPSDHMISGSEAYAEAIQKGVEKAKEGYIVTFGIKPTRPETGYGYIEYEDDLVKSFREKPNLDTAEDFLERGNFLWNSGMFCFQASVFLDELKQYEPKVYEKAKKAWEISKGGILDEELSLEIPSISVDYAVMERSKRIRVVPTSFEWSDLGSFEALYDYLVENGYPKDDNGNIVIGTETFTGFVGLKNTIFIYTKDAFLIVQKEKSQDVKKIYNMLDKLQSKLLD
ncbi:mannose-1-phosphate guanylyltransferase [Sphingobacterium litopenaei]|uniref:NTP transferase domain-containing protein n=1 Tax=Sphingobacterium litopenaei TaxID=2763500 RepID=A0ABR7YER3_9SPHI|nr:mannose-1-phosphate guanylyltransferase [Sphingobacterium litopenaei]MBD1429776.1 NTP transferase domain-containing protein [Sphingobacterium litopenaei]